MSPRKWGVVEIRITKRRVGRTAGGPPRGLRRHLPEMIAMHTEGQTLQQIGERFGCTREYIRQIFVGTEGHHARGRTLRAIKAQLAFPMTFARSMKRHLWAAGYRRCSACKIWSEEPTKKCRRCRKCNADYGFAHHGSRPELRGITQSARIGILWADGSMKSRMVTR